MDGRLKKNRRILIAVVINILAVLFLNAIFRSAEKTDDLLMKFILSGTFSGEADGHLLYTNYIFGSVLSLLQRLIPISLKQFR